MDRIINVLQIGMTRNIGGMEVYLINQLRELNPSKIHFDFLNITDEYPIAYQDEIINRGCKIYGVPSRHNGIFTHYIKLFRFFKSVKGKYDFVVLNTCSRSYFFPMVIARIYGVPHRIVHSHNSASERKDTLALRALELINKLFLKSATDFWACSQESGLWMFGRNRKFTIVRNAIKVDAYKFDEEKRRKIRAEFCISDETLVVGHVGRFSYQKNHVDVIKIFSEVHKAYDNSKLLLVGGFDESNDYYKDARKVVDELGLDNSVIFAGMRSDVCDIYSAMDVFLFPSHFEGFSIAGIEAQASGLECFFSNKLCYMDITPLAHFHSLEEPVSEWSHDILQCINKPRFDYSNLIGEKGCDIPSQIRFIENFYSSQDSQTLKQHK